MVKITPDERKNKNDDFKIANNTANSFLLFDFETTFYESKTLQSICLFIFLLLHLAHIDLCHLSLYSLSYFIETVILRLRFFV